jgi:hypothetical protein
LDDGKARSIGDGNSIDYNQKYTYDRLWIFRLPFYFDSAQVVLASTASIISRL